MYSQLNRPFARLGGTQCLRQYIRHVPDSITEWYAFKKAFDAYMRFKNPNKKWEATTKKTGPFQRLGYSILNKTSVLQGENTSVLQGDTATECSAVRMSHSDRRERVARNAERVSPGKKSV